MGRLLLPNTAMTNSSLPQTNSRTSAFMDDHSAVGSLCAYEGRPNYSYHSLLKPLYNLVSGNSLDFQRIYLLKDSYYSTADKYNTVDSPENEQLLWMFILIFLIFTMNGESYSSLLGSISILICICCAIIELIYIKISNILRI